HDDDGSLGWIVNGETVEQASTIVRATGLVEADAPLPAGFSLPAKTGGPVSPETVWILYRRAAETELLPASIAIGDSIAVTASAQALETIISGRGPEEFRLLVGYAGWGPGQLARELSLGAWLPSAADADLLFHPEHATLWRRAYAEAIGTVPEAFVSTTRGLA
ncbi:MAG TPA: YqgE/AlgH family protein, partial [Labilithrix sp.]